MGTQKDSRRLRIKLSIRAKISGTADKPRLSVFRSNTGIYAQVIDDVKGHTLAASSSQELGLANGNVDNAKQVGVKIAEKALAAGVSTVIFDRNGYLYHGRVKAVAEGAREGGLKF
jgi:large subunit ribosomal protein L18